MCSDRDSNKIVLIFLYICFGAIWATSWYKSRRHVSDSPGSFQISQSIGSYKFWYGDLDDPTNKREAKHGTGDPMVQGCIIYRDVVSLFEPSFLTIYDPDFILALADVSRPFSRWNLYKPLIAEMDGSNSALHKSPCLNTSCAMKFCWYSYKCLF